jgi:hypothetical protein
MSHFFLPTQWQSKVGTQSLSWDYANAVAATTTNFQPSLKDFSKPFELGLVVFDICRRPLTERHFSYKINRPIYLLLGSFLL